VERGDHDAGGENDSNRCVRKRGFVMGLRGRGEGELLEKTGEYGCKKKYKSLKKG